MARSSSDVRSVVLLVLERVDQGGQIQAVLAEVLRQETLSLRDRHLITELSYGILRTGIRLQHLLTLSVPRVNALPRKCVLILYIGMYSLLFLSRIPEYAAVSQAVLLAKKVFGRELGNLVNAVLRTVSRIRDRAQKIAFYRTVTDENCFQSMARYYSVPFWLMEFWRNRYGTASAIRLVLRSSERPRTAVLINQTHPKQRMLAEAMERMRSSHGGMVKRIGSCGYVLEQEFPGDSVCDSGSLEEWHREGVFSYQSYGSQAVLWYLGLRVWRKPVWDVCAGAGGKSALLAEAGVPIALCTDISWKRLSHLRADFRRRGLPVPLCVLADGVHPPVRAFSGNILLDVPCSGLGILARRPDLRQRRKTRRSIRHFPELQKALLDSAASFLEPGCELAYITCTLNPGENEEQTARFLEAHPDCVLVTEWQTPHSARDMEGMYGVRVRRSR